MNLRCIATIAFLLLAAAIVWAQDEEARKHLLHDLGGPFIVYRANLQEELKLSDDQKQKLLEKLPDFVDLERGKKMQSVRQKSHEKLWAFLKETMKAEPLKRFQQLELQHEGPAAIAGQARDRERTANHERATASVLGREKQSCRSHHSPTGDRGRWLHSGC